MQHRAEGDDEDTMHGQATSNIRRARIGRRADQEVGMYRVHGVPEWTGLRVSGQGDSSRKEHKSLQQIKSEVVHPTTITGPHPHFP